MALGYQRIHDVSPLSMKLLNDQLEQMWKKVMGGLELRDMTPTVAATINAAVTEGRFTTMIEQLSDEIRLAVESSAGDNLIMNGNAAFGTESWEAQGCGLSSVARDWGGMAFAVSGAGMASQGPFALRAGVAYALRFAYESEMDVSARIVTGSGVVAEETWEAASEWRDATLQFTPEQGGDAVVEMVFAGTGTFGEVMLAEGNGGTWRQNPNEVKNSSISLTDERVSIDTRNFALRLYNPTGQLITEMTADEQGFSNLFIAENMILRGKEFYLGDGEYHLWVHPNADRAGIRRIFTNNGAQPVSLEGCFPDIQEAIDAVPRWCDGKVTIHIHGGAAWQYPSSRLLISHFYGGGRIVLAPWVSTAHYTLKRVEVLNNSLVVDIQGADINSCGAQDCFHVENSVLMMYECAVNGRNNLAGSGSAAYDAAYGALMLITACRAYNCHTAAHAYLGGRIYMESCAGSGNTAGVRATLGGIIQQAQSTFDAATTHFEASGGKILTQVNTTSAGIAPVGTPMEHVATFTAQVTGCLDQDRGWITSPDWIRAGARATGLIWFDTAALRSALSARTIVYAGLTMRRRGEGGRAGTVPITLYDLKSHGPGGVYSQGANHGELGAWRRGERKTVPVPVGAVETIVRIGAAGFALVAGEECVFEGISEGPPVLEVVYR